MAEFHPIVVEILAPLLENGAAGLAQLALERIEMAEQVPSDDIEEERDPFSASPGESQVARGMRQLKIADDAIGGLLRIEESASIQLSEIAPQFGCTSVASVRAGAEVALLREGLTTADRRQAVATFLMAWTEAVRAARTEIEARDAR